MRRPLQALHCSPDGLKVRAVAFGFEQTASLEQEHTCSEEKEGEA